jgi:hypothetical protein
MTRSWQALAVGTLGVAAYQWLMLCQWIVSGARSGRLEVTSEGGVYALPFIVVGSAATAALVTWRVRGSSPGFARCSRTAIYLLLGGLALLYALMASPLAVLVRS